jgi:hypothetical protein
MNLNFIIHLKRLDVINIIIVLLNQISSKFRATTFIFQDGGGSKIISYNQCGFFLHDRESTAACVYCLEKLATCKLYLPQCLTTGFEHIINNKNKSLFQSQALNK